MVSKAGLNSQSVNRLDALGTNGGAELVGADTANGLAGTTVQQQINELVEAASGGGSAMKVVDRQIVTIPAGRPAGVILTAAAIGDKQRLRIRVLGTATATVEGAMTLSIDDFDYINNGGLGGLTAIPVASQFLVTPNPRAGNQDLPLLYREIVCKTFTLTKVLGSTVQIIHCAYDILEPLE